MVSIAHYWQHANKWRNVVVYSNCDEVELYLNDRLLARQRPDKGPETGYGTDLSEGGKPFDGGNANHLPHPPFTFKDITFQKGSLRAVGYIGGSVAATQQIHTPGGPAKLGLEVAENGKPVKPRTKDVFFVYAKITDRNGNLVPNAHSPVTLSIKGNARLRSPATVNAEAGIATFIVDTDETSRTLEITAVAPDLLPAKKALF